MVAVYGLGQFLFSVPVGQAADRFGRRGALFAGTLLTCAGSLLCGLADDFAHLLLYRFIAGIGSTAVITGTQIVVADVATRENRGRMIATSQGFFASAVGVGPGVGGLVVVLAGPRAPFFVFAALTLVAGVLALTQLPETRPRPAPRPAPAAGATTAPDTTPGAAPGAAPGRGVVRRLLTNPGFLCVSFVTFQATFTRTGAIFSVVPLVGVERIGLDVAAIGLAITSGNLLNLATIAGAGVLVDRYGRKPVIIPSCLITACAFAGFAFAPSYPAFVFSAILWGIGSALGGSAATSPPTRPRRGATGSPWASTACSRTPATSSARPCLA